MKTEINCSVCGRPCPIKRGEGKNIGTGYAKCGCGNTMMLSKRALAQFDAEPQPTEEPAHEPPPAPAPQTETDQKKSPERTTIAEDIASGIRRWWNNDR